MQNLSVIRPVVWTPFLKKLMGGLHHPPPPAQARVNPIPDGGGGVKSPPPLCFVLRTIPKRLEILSSYLVTFPKYSLRAFCKKKNKLPGQVRSDHQSGFVDHTSKKVGTQARDRVFHRVISYLQIFIRVPVCAICKLQISELLYLGPEVRFDSRFLHYKPVRKYRNASCFE